MKWQFWGKILGFSVGVVGVLWLIIELINNFIPSWGEAISLWRNGLALWLIWIIAFSAAVLRETLNTEDFNYLSQMARLHPRIVVLMVVTFIFQFMMLVWGGNSTSEVIFLVLGLAGSWIPVLVLFVFAFKINGSHWELHRIVKDQLHLLTAAHANETAERIIELEGEKYIRKFQKVSFIFDDDGKTIYYRTKLQLQALQDNLGLYQAAYAWSAQTSGQIKPEALTPELNFVSGSPKSNGNWSFYYLKLPKTLNRNDILDIEYQFKLDDPDQKTHPHLSQTIAVPTEKLILEVSLPKGSSPSGAYFNHFRDNFSTESIDSKQLVWVGEPIVLNVEVNNPQIKHKYEILWYPNKEIS